MAPALFSLITFLTFTAGAARAASPPLRANPALVLPGPAESFDFMAWDSSLDRVLAAHRGARVLEIVDLKSGKPLKAIAVGAAQGVAMNTAAHIYYLGNEADKNVVAIDANTFRRIGEVKVDGPVDATAFDPTNSRIYAAEDDGTRVWVLHAQPFELAEVVKLPGVPEVLEYDAATDRIYLNIKDKDLVVRIDPATSQVDASWPTAPVHSPHGLVIDRDGGRIITAGGNGIIAALDIHSGKVTASTAIAPGVDQIAFDENEKIVYSAGKGFISATKVTHEGLTSLPDTPSPKGAHTIAVDAKRHEIWISFKDSKHSYLQKFTRGERAH